MPIETPDAKERDFGWIRAFQAGDPSGFEELFKAYIKPLCHFVRKHGGLGEHEAEDLGHDIMIRVYKGLPRYVFNARFSTWLFTIALNQIRNQRRKKTPLSLHQTLGEGAQGIDLLPGRERLPDAQAMDSELRKALDLAIAALPEKERAVFVFREYQGLSFQEIADITGQTLRNIQFIKERANLRLRQALQAQGLQLEASPAQDGTGAP
ncbi:MAG: sigma-70 family RNA polymerase sigma factor [Spirochaetes bacterium]|nr:sigma-70 family RNA polymerase sigma factor [Spirochaetota bacterium]